MTKQCRTCRSHRDPGFMRQDRPRGGHWCSNSSSRYLLDVTPPNSYCEHHEYKDEAIPIYQRAWMRFQIAVMRGATRLMKWISRGLERLNDKI